MIRWTGLEQPRGREPRKRRPIGHTFRSIAGWYLLVCVLFANYVIASAVLTERGTWFPEPFDGLPRVEVRFR